MSGKCFFWHGVKILGTLMSWKPFALPQNAPEKQGTSRLMGKLNPRSPNFLYEITTKTCVPPQETLDLGNDLSIGPQGVLNLKFIQWQKTIKSLGQALGPLSWCEDDAETLAITSLVAPPSLPRVIPVTNGAGGFTPIVGMDVLLRDRTSGEGVVGRIIGVGGGVATVDVEQTGTMPDADYEMVLIRFYYPETIFRGVEGYDTADQCDDKWIPELTTKFKSASDPVYADAYVMDLG